MAFLLSRLTPWIDRVLSRHPVIRPRLAMWAISVRTYATYVALLWCQVGLGFTEIRWAAAFTVAALLINAFTYASIRSGWAFEQRWDPQLSRTDLLLGFAMFWWGYLISGPAALCQIVFVSTQVIYAVFSTPPRHVRWIAALSLLGLGASMTVGSVLDPVRYPPDLQLMGFGYCALVVPLLARLASIWARMNRTLRRQKDDLRDALARLHDLATRDELTRVPNRRHIAELAAAAREESALRDQPCALALLDIDHFKQVNDSFGHPAGDEVLQSFAMSAGRALRASDLFGRWGGEEFLMVLPGSGTDDALQVLVRLRAELRAHLTTLPHLPTVTFSAGVTTLTADDSFEAALARADGALYAAKAAGRDRFEVSSRDAPAAVEAAHRQTVMPANQEILSHAQR